MRGRPQLFDQAALTARQIRTLHTFQSQVFLASGQSNMECPMLTTLSRLDVYAKTAAGLYDHIRLFQTGTRYLGARNTSSWILPAVCNPGRDSPCPNNTEQSHSLSPAYRSWILPRGNAGMDDDADADGFPNRFNAVCWYFGAALSDARAQDPPVPIGLIASSVGGTNIQHWLPPWAAGNATCADNNCGWVEQLDPTRPVQPATTAACTNASLANVYSCSSGTCSTLWHSMIAPYVNVTIAGSVWYQVRLNATIFVSVCVVRTLTPPPLPPTHTSLYSAG